MIVCNKHPKKYVLAHCALQEHVTLAIIDAQRHGEAALVVLIDREDPSHVGVGYIGDAACSKPLRLCLRALGMDTSS